MSGNSEQEAIVKARRSVRSVPTMRNNFIVGSMGHVFKASPVGCKAVCFGQEAIVKARRSVRSVPTMCNNFIVGSG
jgi:hypothetical protein